MKRHFLLLSFILFFIVSGFAQRVETTILHGTTDGKIEQYQTLELGLRIPEYEKKYQNFLSAPHTGIGATNGTSNAKNPYAEKFLRVQFNCNGKSYVVPAFYMQETLPDAKTNRYVQQSTTWPWRIRFAIPDTGNWNCVILIGEVLEKAIPKSCPITFSSYKGMAHGFIKIAADQKHFQYSDGTPFFVLGQNIGWSDSPAIIGQSTWPQIGYNDVYHFINNLADNGGNFVRMVMAPWSTALLWNEISVFDQSAAFALDSMINIAESRGMKVHLCLDLTTGFIKGDSKENQNPIRRNFQKEGMTASGLLADSSALDAFDCYIRYVYARYAFSSTVATVELIGEQDRWEGYSGNEKKFAAFYLHISKLLQTEFGNNHLISTSTNQERLFVSANPAIGFIDVHHYDNDFLCNQKRFKIISSRRVKKINKPFLFGELGMINGPINAADAGDFEGFNDISMHNAMWATLFMGGAGIGSPWWSWSNDNFRTANYPFIRYFLDSIAGNSIYKGESKMWTGNGLECFYQSDKNSTLGWVHNTSYWWGNMLQDSVDRNKKHMILPKDNDKTEKPENREGNTFIIDGLKRGAIYSVDLYSTREKGKVLYHYVLKASILGKISIPYPNQPDCAFRITKKWLAHI